MPNMVQEKKSLTKSLLRVSDDFPSVLAGFYVPADLLVIERITTRHRFLAADTRVGHNLHPLQIVAPLNQHADSIARTKSLLRQKNIAANKVSYAPTHLQ